MIIKKFVVSDMGNNNYLLIDGDEAVLIDSTGLIPELDSVLNEYSAKLKYILLTHCHFDHILGVVDYQKKYGAKVGIHIKEKENLEKTDEFLDMYGIPRFEVPVPDFYLDDNDTVKFGEEEIKVIHLPGHTSGGAGFLVGNNLFSGDTIFLGSVGRSDLPTGDFETLKETIHNKIFTLDDNIIIHTGHGAQTSVGQEKKYNSFV